MDRSHRHLQLEVVQPVGSFACICIMNPSSFPWGSRDSASREIQSVCFGGLGRATVKAETCSLSVLGESFPHCLTPLSFLSGASGPKSSEVRILPVGGDPDTKDGTLRMVSGRRFWEVGIRFILFQIRGI